MEKELFEELVNSMAEMVAIEKGELVPASENIHRHVLPDVKAIRKEVGMRQTDFLRLLG